MPHYGFDLHLPDYWLMVLEIVSHAYLPFAYVFQQISFHVETIFQLDCLSLSCGVLRGFFFFVYLFLFLF